MRRSIHDWFDAALDYVLPLGFGLSLLGLLVALVIWASHADDAKCANILSSAHTSRDTMDAKIACEQIHAATSQAITIGVAAGVVAGSAASSSSSPSRR